MVVLLLKNWQAYLPLLEHFFDENPFPTHADKVFLAKKSNMQYRQIHVWVSIFVPSVIDPVVDKLFSFKIAVIVPKERLNR